MRFGTPETHVSEQRLVQILCYYYHNIFKYYVLYLDKGCIQTSSISGYCEMIPLMCSHTSMLQAASLTAQLVMFPVKYGRRQ